MVSGNYFLRVILNLSSDEQRQAIINKALLSSRVKVFDKVTQALYPAGLPLCVHPMLYQKCV